jgi:hypothetical protein
MWVLAWRFFIYFFIWWELGRDYFKSMFGLIVLTSIYRKRVVLGKFNVSYYHLLLWSFQRQPDFSTFFFLREENNNEKDTYTTLSIKKIILGNHLGGGPVVRAWDQEVCFLCGLRFEPCGYSYDGHWRLTWSLTSGPVGLVEVRANWPGHPR